MVAKQAEARGGGTSHSRRRWRATRPGRKESWRMNEQENHTAAAPPPAPQIKTRITPRFPGGGGRQAKNQTQNHKRTIISDTKAHRSRPPKTTFPPCAGGGGVLIVRERGEQTVVWEEVGLDTPPPNSPPQARVCRNGSSKSSRDRRTWPSRTSARDLVCGGGGGLGGCCHHSARLPPCTPAGLPVARKSLYLAAGWVGGGSSWKRGREREPVGRGRFCPSASPLQAPGSLKARPATDSPAPRNAKGGEGAMLWGGGGVERPGRGGGASVQGVSQPARPAGARRRRRAGRAVKKRHQSKCPPGWGFEGLIHCARKRRWERSWRERERRGRGGGAESSQEEGRGQCGRETAPQPSGALAPKGQRG